MGYGSLVVLIKLSVRAGLNAGTALVLRLSIDCLVRSLIRRDGRQAAMAWLGLCRPRGGRRRALLRYADQSLGLSSGVVCV